MGKPLNLSTFTSCLLMAGGGRDVRSGLSEVIHCMVKLEEVFELKNEYSFRPNLIDLVALTREFANAHAWTLSVAMGPCFSCLSRCILNMELPKGYHRLLCAT